MTRRSLAILATLVLVLVSCGASVRDVPPPATSAAASAAPAFPTTLTDFQGRSVTVAQRPQRLISIGPSVTEFIYALGAGPRVVGDDDFSDTPAAAAKVEHVGGVKVNLEKIVALKPDLILTVKFSDGTIEKLQSAGLVVLVVDPQSASDVARTATLVGKAVGADGEALASDITKRVDAVRSATAKATVKPRVYHEIDASDPTKIFSVGPGSYIADLIDIAGGTNILAKAQTAYPQVSAEEILRADPEIIVVAAADYAAKPDQIAARPGWSVISAVKNRRIGTIEPALIDRPGPRIGEAAEAYARIVHPELFR